MSDLISRQDAINLICEHGTDLERRGIMVLAVANHKQVTVDLLENLPTATERKTGEWIDTGSGQECSNCHEIQIGYDSFRNYCPYCGSDMRRKNEEGEE